MTDEEKEIKEWIDERRKGSDLMCKLLNRNENLEKENAELKAQNKGLIHLLESIQSVVSGIKKNKDKEIILYWIEENAIRVFKQEKQKGFSFDWLK